MISLEFIQHLPIKRKLTLIVLTACSVILLLACSGLFAFQKVLFRKTFAQKLVAIAQVVADNSAGAASFGDKKAADEILATLMAQPYIVSAGIELADGKELAVAGPTQILHRTAVRPLNEGARYEGSDLLLSQPITLKGEKLGTLRIVANLQAVNRDLLLLFAVSLALVLGGSFIIALLLASRLQRFITDPVLHLAEVARDIGERSDYSVRAKKFGCDEFGLLTDTFNEMLTRIESQDKALRYSEARYRLLFQGSPLPMWVYDLESLRYLAVNDAAVAHYGYTEAEFLGMTLKDIRPTEDLPRLTEAVAETGRDFQPSCDWRHRKKDGTMIDVEITSHGIEFQGRVAKLVLALDVTERKRAEAELGQMHKQLVDISRQAGMAEIATGVLHNVGNVLNSVNVSATLSQELVRQSTVRDLSRIGDLLRQHTEQMDAFLTTDPRGKLIPNFLIKIADQINAEQQELVLELTALSTNVEHIKEIVAMQQTYARVSGVTESLAPAALIEDALRMSEAGLARHGVRIVRDFQAVRPVIVDKHKVLQILLNLINNGKDALVAASRLDKQLRLGLRQTLPNRIQIEIEDNGIGIAPENLTRIFVHGFTTKKGGHGFGLHSSANAAKEMGGQLRVHSGGLGLGATCTFELPVNTTQ